MFKSKMIYDPTQTNRWSKQGNLMGLTVGITFHTPKYSKCKPEQILVSQFDAMQHPEPLSEETLERRFRWWYGHTYFCKKKRHLDYTGYMYWTGPKRRYTFRYMGRSSLEKYQGLKWWNLVSVHKHGRYTRWFDNGPQNPPRNNEFNARDIKILDRHARDFRTAMESSRQQMHEYIRIRSADGGRS